jgi:hypothetical protein
MTEQDKTKPHRETDAEGKTTHYLGDVKMNMSPQQQQGKQKPEEKK